MGKATERLLIPFDGPTGGVSAPTWGQTEIWPVLRGSQRAMTVGGVMALPDGATVAETIHVLTFVTHRHQALRTRFDVDFDGRLVQQIVAGSGELVLEIADADSEGDPAVVASEVLEEYERRPFDHATQWPLRMAVVRHRGRLTHAIAVYSHLVIDAHGLDALARDLSNLDRDTGGALAPVTATQPLEQAAWQHGPRGRRQADSALHYWQRLLRTIPARRFRPIDSGEPPGPHLSIVEASSSALGLALRSYTARTRADSSTVILAAMAVILTRLNGTGPAVICEVVSNRFRPGLAESVGVMNQNGLCVIDVAGVAFDEAVARTWQSCIGARMNAYYDPDQLRQLVARTGHDRGEELDLSCFFNYVRREQPMAPSDPTPSRDEIHAALPRTTLRWGGREERPHERCFLNVVDAADGIGMTLYADARVLSGADQETLLRGIEAVVVEAATNAS